jgi:hypothetical protein
MGSKDFAELRTELPVSPESEFLELFFSFHERHIHKVLA